MPHRRAAVLVCFLAACSQPEGATKQDSASAVDTGMVIELSVVPTVASGTHLTQALGECTRVASLQPHRHVCVRADGAWLVDESGPTELWLADAHSVAGVRVDSAEWLALDGELVALVDNTATPLDLGIPVPIEAMQVAGGSVWLHGAGRLFEVVGGSVHEVKVDGVATIHGFAATADRLYLSTPTLLALDRGATGLSVAWQWHRAIDALTVDENSLLWMISEDATYASSAAGPPRQVALPGTVHSLVGPHLWLLGDGQAWRQAGQSFTELTLPAEPAHTVATDTLGRLLQLTDSGLLRHAVGRPVAVVGLPDSLEVQQEVLLLPSAPDSLTRLSAWVDDRAIAVQTAPHALSINPEQLAGGAHELRFLTESELGDHIATWPLWVGSLPDTQWADIAEISEAHCLSCHGGDTVTRLETADDWRIHIDDIIALVSSGEMPLGGSPLSDDDIVRIRAWKHGGFE